VTDTAFDALVLAWKTTVILIALFVVALALSRIWDSVVCLPEPLGVLSLGPDAPPQLVPDGGAWDLPVTAPGGRRCT
jgi:hypothetical protein